MGCCSNKAPNTADAGMRHQHNQKESSVPLNMPYEPEPAPSCHSQEVADAQGFLRFERRPSGGSEDFDLGTVEEGQSAGLLPQRKLQAPALLEAHPAPRQPSASQGSKAVAGEPQRGGTVLLGRTKALVLVAGALALVAVAGWRLRSSGRDESEASKVLVAVEHPEWGAEGFTTTTTTTTISTTTGTRKTSTRSITRTSTTEATTTTGTTSPKRITMGQEKEEELAPSTWLGQGDSRDLDSPFEPSDTNNKSIFGGSGITDQGTVFSTFKPPTTTNTTTLEATLPTTTSADMTGSGSVTTPVEEAPSARGAITDATNASTVVLGLGASGSDVTSIVANTSVLDRKPASWPLSMNVADWKAVAAIASRIAAWKANASSSDTEAETPVLGTSADNESGIANATLDIAPVSSIKSTASNKTIQHSNVLLGSGVPDGDTNDDEPNVVSLPLGMTAAQAAGLPLGMSASQWKAVAAITARIARWRVQAVEAPHEHAVEHAAGPMLGMSISADTENSKQSPNGGSAAVMLGSETPDNQIGGSSAASSPLLDQSSPAQSLDSGDWSAPSTERGAVPDSEAREFPFGMSAKQWSVVTALAVKVTQWKAEGMNSTDLEWNATHPAMEVDYTPADNESIRQMQDMEGEGSKHHAWSVGLSKGAKAGLGVGVPLGVATLLGGLLGGLLGTTVTTTLTSSSAMVAPEMLATTTLMWAPTTLGNFSLGGDGNGGLESQVVPFRKLPDENLAQNWCTSWWIALAVVPLLLASICLYFVLRPRAKRTRSADDARLISQDGASPSLSIGSSPDHTRRSGEWDFSAAANVRKGCCGSTAAEFAEETHPQASAVQGLYDTIDRDGKGYITKSDFKSAPVAARAAATAAMAAPSSVSFVTQLNSGMGNQSVPVPGVGAPLMSAQAQRVSPVILARQQHFVEPVAVPPQAHLLPSVAPRQA